MYRHYLSILLACLIGTSTSFYGAESSFAKATADMAVKTAEIAPIAEDVAPAPVVTIATLDGKQVPMLINFDQGLYNSYCQSCQSSYKWSLGYKLVALSIATIVIGSQVSAFVQDPVSFALLTKLGFLEWRNSVWYQKLGTIVFKAIPTGFKFFSFATFVFSSIQGMQTIESDITNFFLWEEREEELLIKEKQSVWHQEIYKLFGNPEVVGTFPVTGTYTLRGYREYMRGQAVFGPFEFDPFDREQVKTLLGLGATQQDLRCSKIEIIVVS